MSNPSLSTRSSFVRITSITFLIGLFLVLSANAYATTYFSKAAATDFTNVASWGTNADGSGTSPGSISNADDFTIANGSAMNLNAGSAAVRSLTINTGSLTVGTNTLTVSIASQNNSVLTVNSGGTLTVSGGTITLNGNMLVASGATFNQSSGLITVDGNNAGVAGTSVASGTVLVAVQSALGTVTGGTMTIVDPPATGSARSFEINLTTGTPQWGGHTLRLGDGVSTDSSTNTSGFQFDTYVGSSSTQAMIGNLIIDGGSGTNRFATTTSASANGSFVKNDLTINSGSELRDVASGGTLVVAGNITNNGTFTKANTLLALLTFSGSSSVTNTNAQTIGGSGVFRNSTTSSTANFTSLQIANSNASGVTFSNANSLLSGSNTGTVSGTLTWTAGFVNTSGNTFVLGTGTGVLGTLTYTAGGFTSGSIFGRWYAAATAGTTITAATLPTVTGTTGSYPFLIGTNARNFFVNRPSTTGATGGIIAVSHADGAGLNTIGTVTDGAYSINRQTNANWTVSTAGGFAAGTGTFSYAVSGQGTYTIANGNSRVMKVATVVGTHQTGTTLPHGQRTAIAAADYTGTFYLGLASSDIPAVSTQSGAWDDPATWGGTAPVCGTSVIIASGHTVTVSGAAANAGSVTVNSGGTLVVSGNTLTVGCTLNNSTLTNNGTFTVSGGTVNVNGNVVYASGSTFNQSAGSIVVDGNAAGVAGNSVASGTVIFQVSSALGTVSGGSITIVDPPAAGTARSLAYSVSSTQMTWGTGHTLNLGDGTSTDASTATNGFEVDCFTSTGRLLLGSVVVQGGSGTNRWAGSSSSSSDGTFIGGTLTVNSGSEFRNVSAGAVLTLAGNLTNNGTYTALTGLTCATVIGNTVSTNPSAQTIGGSGTYRNLTASATANLTNLTANNSSSTGVTVNSMSAISGQPASSASVSGTLTFTSGRITTGSGASLVLGTSAPAAGTLTVTAGGFAAGSTYGRWSTAAGTGSSITASSDPSTTTSRFPFLAADGSNRSIWYERSCGTCAAGVYAVTYADASTLSSVSIVDGAYTVQSRYDGNWTFSTLGTSPAATSYEVAIVAPGAYPALNGNGRVLLAAAPAGGTHQAGTATPGNQRAGLTHAQLISAPYYIGAANADLSFQSVASGDWATGSTWNKGTVPTSADPVTIASGHTVSVTTAGQAASTLNVLSGGTLSVSGGSLTTTTTLTNSGTVNVGGGALTTTTTLTNNASSNVNVSAGTLGVTTTMTNTGTFTGSGGITTVTAASGTGITNTGTFTVSGGTVNLGPQDNSACNRLYTNTSGTLGVSSGTFNIAGRLLVSSGSTLSQSGGDINVDGNAAGVSANSVASSTAIVDLNPSLLTSINLTGGTLTIVDPHANATASNSLLVTGSTAGSLNVTSGHTIRFGNGTSTDAGGNATNGFRVNTWATTTGMPFGNVVLPGPTGTNRYLTGAFQQPILGNVTVNSGGEFRIGTAYVNGNVTVDSGGTFTSTTELRMSNSVFVDGSTVTTSASTNAQTIGGTGTYQNLTASPTANLTALTIFNSNASGVTLANADKSVSGTLSFIQGTLTTGANKMVVNSTGSVSRTVGHVIGNLQRTFTATGSLTFDVGTANGYSPVAVNATAGTFPANFVAKAVQGAHPNLFNAAKALSRYWTLTGSGITADLTFNYLDPTDIPGTATEANFVIQKYSGGFTQPGGSVNTTANTASISGVSSFSDWTLAEPGGVFTPTATNTNTPTPTATETFTPTATNTATFTPTETFTPTPTATNTDTPTPTATETFTPTNTATNTNTPTATATETFTPTNTATNTDTPTPTATETFTPTNTATNTNTPTSTATETSTPTNTATFTPTPVDTATNTDTPTPTNTATNTATSTSTATSTPTYTPTCVPISIPTGNQTLSGVTFTVPVNTGDVTGHSVLSADFTVTYDPAVLTPLANPTFGVTLGAVGNSNGGGRTLTAFNPSAGTLNISIFGTEEMTGGGVLVNLNFNVIGVPGTSSALNLTAFKYNEGTPCTDRTNGDVTVIPGSIAGTINYGNPVTGTNPRGVPGVLVSGAGSPAVSDTTGAPGTYSLTGFGAGAYTVTPTKSGGVNGSITSFDSAKIAQYVTGNATLTAAQLSVADVTSNSTVTSFDAAMIARYVATLGPPQGNTGTWIFNPSSRNYPTVYANYTGEDYAALLMGDVSGNWGDPSPFRPGMGGPEKLAAVAAPRLVTPADNEVIIPVAIDGTNDKGIISYEFDLRYDPTVIQPQANPVDIQGTLSGSLFTTANADTPGLLRVVVYGPMPLEGSGVLLNLKFVGVGAPGSVSPLTWERIMLNEGTPRITATDGEVKLSASQPNQAEIGGRLLTALGAGVANSRVTLTDAAGQSRIAVSDTAGNYRFGGLQVGQTYTVRVESRGFAFAPLTVSVIGQSTNVDMIARQ